MLALGIAAGAPRRPGRAARPRRSPGARRARVVPPAAPPRHRPRPAAPLRVRRRDGRPARRCAARGARRRGRPARAPGVHGVRAAARRVRARPACRGRRPGRPDPAQVAAPLPGTAGRPRPTPRPGCSPRPRRRVRDEVAPHRRRGRPSRAWSCGCGSCAPTSPRATPGRPPPCSTGWPPRTADWRLDWFRGLPRLADGRPGGRRARRSTPSTPRCRARPPRSWRSPPRRSARATTTPAGRYYTLVARTDPAVADAAFGSARVRLRAGDRAGGGRRARRRAGDLEPRTSPRSSPRWRPRCSAAPAPTYRRPSCARPRTGCSALDLDAGHRPAGARTACSPPRSSWRRPTPARPLFLGCPWQERDAAAGPGGLPAHLGAARVRRRRADRRSSTGPTRCAPGRGSDGRPPHRGRGVPALPGAGRRVPVLRGVRQ